MEIKVEIKNLDKVRSALNKYPAIAAKKMNDAIKKSIMTIERETKPNTPVDTGYLRNSQSSRFLPLKGIYDVTAHYAYYVHEGTRYMKARPFLAQGVEASMSDINRYFGNALKDTLDEVARLT